MTTYTAISSGSLAVGQPLTSAIALALRDNPIAIAEGDASVPSNLLQTRLLGTMTTTSGASQTVSSLTLTPYKFLLFVLNGVGRSSAGGNCGIGAATGVINPLATVAGFCFVELSTGLITAICGSGTTPGESRFGATGYTTATTSVSIVTSGTFNAGSVTVYGIK